MNTRLDYINQHTYNIRRQFGLEDEEQLMVVYLDNTRAYLCYTTDMADDGLLVSLNSVYVPVEEYEMETDFVVLEPSIFRDNYEWMQNITENFYDNKAYADL